MKGRLIFLVILAAGLMFGQAIWDKAVGPEVKGEVALKQFADPSVETGTVQRVMRTDYFGLAWFGYSLLAIAMLAKPVSKLFKDKKGHDEKTDCCGNSDCSV